MVLRYRDGDRRPTSVLILLVLSSALVGLARAATETRGDEHDICAMEGTCADATHTVIRLAKRDDQLAAKIARQHGMHVRGVPFLDSHYFLYHDRPERSRRSKREIHQRLVDHAHVEWAEEQRPKRRTKRDYVHADNIVQQQQQQSPASNTSPLRRRHRQAGTSGRASSSSSLPIPRLPWTDPLYRDQWYIVKGAVGGFDMNVQEAWQLGYAGRNVSVSILDDGIQRDHPDLAENYDPLASTDINDHDDDPTPQNNGDNKHGTRCAGEVAALAGNQHCGVGVAFKALIGGVRMLDGAVSDSVEAAALSLHQDHIAIYSASWGPEDDGKTFDGPGPLAREAFYRGIKNGRGGKGNIFVWASGNGGSREDSCSADGYTTSVYTLSISSATFDNRRPWYLEECPSSIATTYSSANINQPAIVTVDVPSGCTKMHTGTSASAPLAAGIIALALEANPALTWRDMQHIVLRTANPRPLLQNQGWSKNGVGRWISNKFGYGLMDAGAIVKLARVWKTVPEQHICTYEYKLAEPNPRPLTGRFQLNFTLEVNGCETGTPVLFLEHVQVHATVRYGKRGDLKLTLFSPAGTRSVLLPPRPQDFNLNGFHKWPFLSVQQWGEDPRGTWILMVESVTSNRNLAGTFHDWSLLLYGTAEAAQPGDPPHPPSAFRSGQSVFGRGLQQLTSQMPDDMQTAVMKWSTTNGNNISTTDCDAECDDSGCFEPRSATACRKCRRFEQTMRNRAGTKCVARCDDGFYEDEADKRCRQCSSHCKTCTKAEVCETCPGAQLLIDQPHYAQFDHGKCVDVCPAGLVPDYETNLIQARCVRAANLCSEGYFRMTQTAKCLECDEACKTCHGPGFISCDECANGYSNISAGYCRPCCQPAQDPEVYHCVDCSKAAKPRALAGDGAGSTLFWTGVFILAGGSALAVVISFLYFVVRDEPEKRHANIDYAPLSTFGQGDGDDCGAENPVRISLSEDDEEDGGEDTLFAKVGPEL